MFMYLPILFVHFSVISKLSTAAVINNFQDPDDALNLGNCHNNHPDVKIMKTMEVYLGDRFRSIQSDIEDQIRIGVRSNFENEVMEKPSSLASYEDGYVGKYLSETTENGPQSSYAKVDLSKPPKNSSSIPKHCSEVLEKGNRISGIYHIKPDSSETPFAVLCEMELQGGGWTHIQKRYDGSQDFYKGWREYKFGFGNLKGEFWLGLKNTYELTGHESNELLIEIVDRDGEKAYALYKHFAIGRETEGFPLKTLSGFSGDAGDSLTAHSGQKFSTFDFDQDKNPGNCAEMFRGAWWYNSCHISNLNGQYINVDLSDAYKYKGLHWKTFRSHEYCHSKARMLVRPTRL